MMKKTSPIWRSNKRRARGFSLIEMMIATVILLIGLVGIAQLVPASILINQKGRLDSTSLVFAQRELDQMMGQPLTALTFIEANGALCATSCDLGDPSQPGVVVGNPLVWVYNRPLIDFSPTTGVDNYSFNYTDPNDPFGVTYDVRWAVVTTMKGTSIVGKRFFVGVRQLGGNGFVPAVTLDAMVEK
jgi:prepilin-type N-terminal cleavage/methylation domain-containing protein